MSNWNNLSYQTIIGASIPEDKLRVEFANGDVALVDFSQVLSHENNLHISEIKNTKMGFTSNEIVFGEGESIIEIPWDKIRVLTDREFSRAMAAKAEEQAAKVGLKIKRLRERKGIRSNELAERSGVSPQTISRIEKGHQDISFVTLRRLLAAMGYTLQDLATEDVKLEIEAQNVKSLPLLLKKVSRAGIDPKFLTNKVIPGVLHGPLYDFNNSPPELLIDEATAYVSKVYGWSFDDIWGNRELEIEEQLETSPLFKKGTRASYNLIKAYLPYARFLAGVTLKVAHKKKFLPFPDSIEEFKSNLEGFGGLNLKSILEYAWAMGICILPLTDAGTFHGAAWRIEGRHVIILKQKSQSHAKWIFDLLHELFHVFSHLSDENDTVVELVEVNPFNVDGDEKEDEANSFANQVILNGQNQVERYVQEVVSSAGGRIENLQNAVIKVASLHGVRKDSLANYLAYILSVQGRDWWGAADFFQEREPSAFEVAKSVYLSHTSTDTLTPIEFNILNTALDINLTRHENKS